VLLSANALVGTVISDYCWARSVCLLGPLVTQIGITLTFPISLTIDLLKNGDSFTWQYYTGSFLIFLAFGGIIFLEQKEAKQKQLASKEDDELPIVTSTNYSATEVSTK
jgi:drug/metabolite transporter (DMT)-like permease